MPKNPACIYSSACRRQLRKLMDDTSAYDDPDERVGGADMVDYIGTYREQVREVLAKPDPTVRLMEAMRTLIEVAGESVELSDWPELQNALEEGNAALEEMDRE